MKDGLYWMAWSIAVLLLLLVHNCDQQVLIDEVERLRTAMEGEPVWIDPE